MTCLFHRFGSVSEQLHSYKKTQVCSLVFKNIANLIKPRQFPHPPFCIHQNKQTKTQTEVLTKRLFKNRSLTKLWICRIVTPPKLKIKCVRSLCLLCNFYLKQWHYNTDNVPKLHLFHFRLSHCQISYTSRKNNPSHTWILLIHPTQSWKICAENAATTELKHCAARIHLNNRHSYM